MKRRRGPALVAVAAAALALAGCSGEPPVRTGSFGEGDAAPTPTTSTERPPSPSDPTPDGEAPQPDLDLALSEPREDSLYPQVGEPDIDALHYDLLLTWRPDEKLLHGLEVLTFRSTEDDDDFQLDLGEPLEVTEVFLERKPVDFRHTGKDLVVSAPVREDERYELRVLYSGTPQPVAVPTQRSDFNQTGFTITDEGEVWTMQEPWGAYTWYAVNDHPSDKALYDFTLTVPSPWTGVANGELVSTRETNGFTVTEWHLAEPAASYLTTLAFGDYDLTELEGPGGVPIRIFTPADGKDGLPGGLDVAPDAMAWLEQYLGPYPFDTFGIVVVDSQSGMEIQTMVTLGNTAYALSEPVVVHELAHHWYGDQVTPSDWRDVWMNEGMAMYLQGMREAEAEGIPVDRVMDQWAEFEDDEREYAGPPGDYAEDRWGSGNIYYGPALMWHELRERLGDERFFEVVRAWPRSQDNRSASREDLFAFFERTTGEELSDFFDAWLLGAETPDRG